MSLIFFLCPNNQLSIQSFLISFHKLMWLTWEPTDPLCEWIYWCYLLSHALHRDRFKCQEKILLQISFFWRWWIVPGTNSLCIAPALFNKIKFTVGLWQENDIDTTGFAVCFKQALNMHKIWLIIKNTMGVAISLALIGTIKLGIALGLQLWFFYQTTFL